MGRLPYSVLAISNGTERIDLLALNKGHKIGFGLSDWNATLSQLKSGGVYQESPYSDGRRLIDYQHENVVEPLRLKLMGYDQDDIAFYLHKLKKLLESARMFWKTRWQIQPVWLEVQGASETNLRYGAIMNWNIPGEGNPYTSPLHNGDRAVLEEIALNIERLHWQDVPPRASTCLEITGYKEWASFYYMEFNGSTSTVNCGQAAIIQNLHDAAFTAEMWFRLRSIDPVETQYLIGKGEWYIAVSAAQGLFAFVNFINTDSFAAHPFVADNKWHHVALCFNNLFDHQIHLWLDGVEVVGTVGSGSVVSDSGKNLHIGSSIVPNNTIDGDIGWVRVSQESIYTAPFTPPRRCQIPDIRFDTLAIWAYSGTTTTVVNIEGNASLDGTATDIKGHACGQFHGHVSLVEGEWEPESECTELIVANKHNAANISHVFRFDSSSGLYSLNLQEQTPPYALFPSPIGVNDALYLGCSTALTDSGPFCNAVFDLSQVQADLTLVWEYWSGAVWTAFGANDVADNTEGFTKLGMNSENWLQPSNWATTTVEGVTGYWVRLRVSAVGGAPVVPVQQNRPIYSVTWPFVEVKGDAVEGTLPALGALDVTQVPSSKFGVRLEGHQVTTVWIGRRLLSRGRDFTPYLLASDKQNSPLIVPNDGAANEWGVFADDVDSPTGRIVLVNPTGVYNDILSAGWIFLADSDPELSSAQQYMGEFHLFVRVKQIGGNNGDFSMWSRVSENIDSQLLWVTPKKKIIFPVMGEPALVDLGTVKMAIDWIPGQRPTDIWLQLITSNSNATPGDLKIYDAILMPVDEWSCTLLTTTNPYAGPKESEMLGENNLTLDSTILKPMIRASLLSNMVIAGLDDFRNEVGGRRPEVTNGPFVVHPKEDQRFWFLFENEDHDCFYTGSIRVKLRKTQRYLGLRGKQ